MKPGCSFHYLFAPLSSDLSVNINAGMVAERVSCCARSTMQETQIQRGAEACQRIILKVISWHGSSVSNPKVTLSRLHLGISVLHYMHLQWIYVIPKFNLALVICMLCTACLVSHSLVCHFSGCFGWKNLKVATADAVKAGEWEGVCACLHGTAHINLITGSGIYNIFPPEIMHVAVQLGCSAGFFR